MTHKFVDKIYMYIYPLVYLFSFLLLCCFQWLSHFQLFVTPRTVACQALVSIGFHRQELWSGLPFPPPGVLPDPGIELESPALAGRFFTTEPPGKPACFLCCCSVPKSCLILCNPMDCSIPSFPVLHYLLEFVQMHVS